MSKYVENILGNGETIEYQAAVSHWNFIGNYIFGTITILIGILGIIINVNEVVIGGIGLGLLLLIPAYVTLVSTELAITNRRVIAKYGFIRRETVEINMSKIESIKVSQNILERLFNYGTISVIGSGSTRAAIVGIDDPIVFRRKYDEAANPISNVTGHQQQDNDLRATR